MHTAEWDPAIDVTGRRVGVIGTGASAIQLVPAIAGRAARITVFQRTAPWTLPKPNRRYGPIRRAVNRRFPAAMRLFAQGMISIYRGNRLLNALINDRGRMVIGYLALYLQDGGAPRSGCDSAPGKPARGAQAL